MVGPWLFWLGPMIISMRFLRLSAVPLAWHCFLAFLRWHCVGFFMIVIGGVLVTILGFLGREEGRIRYLADQWLVTMMNFLRRFHLWLLAGWTHCMLSAPM